ncbi:MAG TPA: M48 family metallopeptidase, partial [Steroidobacteraceae bacterium]|nr:M48 family metallopeptidase [Steroidobacteraceae bacterium]
MDILYPPGPSAVPATLTQPTRAYRHHAWLAMAGLLLFVALYFAMTGWFAWTAYKLLSAAFSSGHDAFSGFIVGLCAAFLAVFMAKAIFFIKHAQKVEDIEIKPEQHQKLFAFLYRLADEAHAPRPHRVFLSPRVNAAVFYDLSILNLLFPSKKNLEIGLALVNVLSLGELKAVLAHEFGHFAQRSMAVGRWVYIAQQIAGQIIAKRDILDRFLDGLSRIDIRIAWVGWLLSLVVWSLRSITETAFRVVVLAQRALSREMELQADLVAVSLTGSDALVHALYRLHTADEAWTRTLNFAGVEANEGRAIADVFAVQTRVIDHLRNVFNNADFGDVPAVAGKPDTHRIFKTELAQSPRMWSTHPANSERENNAKRTYIQATVDARSAWELFDNVPALKEEMSRHILRDAKKTEPHPLDATLKKLDEQYERPFLNRSYRGTYLGRSIARHAKTVSDLYDAATSTATEFSQLYPESLAADIERLRELEEEIAALQALQDGVLTAPGGVIRHRGRDLRKRELPRVISALRDELARTRENLHTHDRRCRTTCLRAATNLGGGWDTYVKGLLSVVHFADHTEANIRDAHGLLGNVYAVVT